MPKSGHGGEQRGQQDVSSQQFDYEEQQQFVSRMTGGAAHGIHEVATDQNESSQLANNQGITTVLISSRSG